MIKPKMEQVFDRPEKDNVAMEAIMENYPNGGIDRVISLVNADYADPENVPSGIIMIHPPKAVVHPDSVPNELFEYITVCKIQDKDNHLNDSFFTNKEELLKQGIPQYSATPPRLNGVYAKCGDDASTWEPELGRNGFVGIYKQTHINQRDTDYFVVAKAQVSVAARELKRQLIRSEGRKFQELINDKAFNFTTKLAERNTARLAYCAAKILNVKLEKKIEDIRAHTKAAYIARPFLGVSFAGISQPSSSIENLVWKGQEKVALFHKARSARRLQNIALVYAGPYNGLTIFKLNKSINVTGMPGTTKTRPDKDLRAKVSTETLKRRARGFTWDGKQALSHPMLHPKKFDEVDDNFLKVMKNLGWQQEGVKNRYVLVPIIVKLANPELERK